MSVDEPVVRCGDCLTVLPEPPNTPPERRIPCPKCGSTTRNYAIELRATLFTQADMVQPGMMQPAESSTSQDTVATLEDAGYEVQWLRLSEGGAWMVRVFDREGDFIDGAIQDDPTDALLAVAERLLP